MQGKFASIGNTIYMMGGELTNALYTVNKDTGVATRIVTITGFSFGISSPTTGFVAIGNTLYVADNVTNALYTVNKDTGVATRVGDAVNFGVDETSPSGLASL